MDWISFQRWLSSVDFRGSLDNPVRQLKLEKINLTLSGEMKDFYFSSHSVLNVVESRQVVIEENILLSRRRDRPSLKATAWHVFWAACKQASRYVFIFPKLTLSSKPVPEILPVQFPWQAGGYSRAQSRDGQPVWCSCRVYTPLCPSSVRPGSKNELFLSQEKAFSKEPAVLVMRSA